MARLTSRDKSASDTSCRLAELSMPAFPRPAIAIAGRKDKIAKRHTGLHPHFQEGAHEQVVGEELWS